MNNIGVQNEQVTVSLDVVWHGESGKYDARMSEISMDGCFIDSMGQEVLGESIDFKVRLPSGIWVTLEGDVIAQEYPIGFEVRFNNLDEDNRRLLIEVVAAHGGKQAQQFVREEREKAVGAFIRLSSPRILVAEDDEMTLEIIKAIVETAGYEVVCAADGREAFRVLQQDADFCAAIFDMTMPHLNGIDLIQYMKTDDRLRSIPIGMITAEQDPKIWDDSVAAGASVFLPEPFSPPQIQMMLRILVKKAEPQLPPQNVSPFSQPAENVYR